MNSSPNYLVARRFNEPNDRSGLIQSLGVLAVAGTTATLTATAFWSHHYWLSLVCFIAHGNVCSLFIAAVHELSHKRVFKSEKLSDLFRAIYGFLNWTDIDAYYAIHKGHHINTLNERDTELKGACMVLWSGTFIWAAVFNVPKAVVSIWRCFRNFSGIPAAHLFAIAGTVVIDSIIGNHVPWITIGWLMLVTLAPFWFGWIELAFNFPQHAGLEIGRRSFSRESAGHEIAAVLQLPILAHGVPPYAPSLLSGSMLSIACAARCSG
jgi:fatty acid desaturase